MCWSIGKYINKELLDLNRGDYGEKVIEYLAQELLVKYGRGYSRPNLFRMVKFAKLYPDKEIISTLSRQLSLRMICSIEDKLK